MSINNFPHCFERIEASEIREGDRISKTQDGPIMTVANRENGGTKSNYIVMVDGSRIRPRHTTKFWRVLEQPSLPGVDQ